MIHVLIVEDDPMVAELNRCYLAKLEGFCLAGIAGNYLQALEKLKTDAIDLILMDIFMPGINGLELLAKIREPRLFAILSSFLGLQFYCLLIL